MSLTTLISRARSSAPGPSRRGFGRAGSSRGRITRRAAPVLWATGVLLVGLTASYAVSTNSRTALAVAAGVIGLAVLTTLFFSNVNLLYIIAFAALPTTTLSGRCSCV